jgi:hypothetical protein
MSSHIPAVLPLVRTVNAAAFPGITHASRVAVQQLLDENRKNHIFFNDMKFHNHAVHHILDAYALGASPARLNEIYKVHSVLQRPAPPKQVQITHDNWKEHLGKMNSWTDILEFFSSEVQQLGIEEAVSKYFFHPDLFARFFSGINHAVIHVGFGITFKEPLLVAEGIAMAALEDDLDILNHQLPPSSPSYSLLEIIEQVRNDSRFDGQLSLGQVIHEKGALLLEYVSKWDVKGTDYDVAAKEKELFEVIVLLVVAICRPGKLPRFDFFLMHSLTSSVFIHELLKFFSIEKGPQILKAHFATALWYYIATARPVLYTDHLKAYATTLPSSANPWLEIVKFGIETNDVHAAKTVYALLQGEAWFGEFDGIFLKAAQRVADAVRVQPNIGIFQGRVWAHVPLGLDQHWEDS